MSVLSESAEAPPEGRFLPFFFLGAGTGGSLFCAPSTLGSFTRPSSFGLSGELANFSDRLRRLPEHAGIPLRRGRAEIVCKRRLQGRNPCVCRRIIRKLTICLHRLNLTSEVLQRRGNVHGVGHCSGPFGSNQIISVQCGLTSVLPLSASYSVPLVVSRYVEPIPAFATPVPLVPLVGAPLPSRSYVPARPA